MTKTYLQEADPNLYCFVPPHICMGRPLLLQHPTMQCWKWPVFLNASSFCNILSSYFLLSLSSSVCFSPFPLCSHSSTFSLTPTHFFCFNSAPTRRGTPCSCCSLGSQLRSQLQQNLPVPTFFPCLTWAGGLTCTSPLLACKGRRVAHVE